MHCNGLGEAESLAREALDARTQRQMLAFELLRIVFANLVLPWVSVALIRAPAIGEVAINPKGC